MHEGTQEQDTYWLALNKDDSRGRILTDAQIGAGGTLMEISTVVLGHEVAFKVENKGADAYLVAREDKTVHVEQVGGDVPARAKFKSTNPLTPAPAAHELNYRSFESVKFAGHYLRHRGYDMFVDEKPDGGSELFNQDSSWLIVASE